MLLINIDKTLNKAVYVQIADQIAELIQQGALHQGDRLPSTRVLSNQLGLNRNTVYKAYEELWARGYLESKSGSFSTVRSPRESSVKQYNQNSTIEWDSLITEPVKRLKDEHIFSISSKIDIDTVDFRPLSPDLSIIPNLEFRKCLNDVFFEKNENSLLYADAMGYRPLREAISKHLQLHGINISENDIVITNGAQNAIELIIKLLLKPKSEIIVESPTYSAIIPLLKFYDLNVIEVPVKENGVDLNMLADILKTRNPRLIYTMPNFQNPTGVTSTKQHRERLLQLSEEYNVPIIEDGFVEEMKYFGKSILPIKSMDKNGIVFYVGTFSKILFPGLRIGWIASNKYCTERFAEIIKAAEISVNSFTQVALYKYLKQGLLDKQLLKTHRLYKRRMATALKLLRENLNNENIWYTKPIGGYTIWFTIHAKISEIELLDKLHQEKVIVTSGSASFYQKTQHVHFRISIAHRSESEIEIGLMKIINVLNNLK